MLEPNVIPIEEPILRVGIFLPIDKCQRIALEIPKSPVYELVSGSGPRRILRGGEQIEFVLAENQIGIQIDGVPQNSQPNWKIIPKDGKIQVANKSGIKVKNVIAGRGFHWQKQIDVYLPGSVEISQIDDNLIMINRLPIEQYLMCVATSEMGAACPLSVIKSQTIIARSWLLANVEMKHRNLGMDVCNDDCCQRYQGTTFLSEQSIKGALETAGQVLIYDDKICDTRYHKNCGGVTESFENVWGGVTPPYLDSVIDAPADCHHPALPLDTEEKVRDWIENPPSAFCSPSIVPEKELKKYLGNVDEKGHYFRWHFRMTQKEITALFNLKLNLKAVAVKSIEPLKRGKSGRLTSLAINYFDKANVEKQIVINDQYAIRDAFHDLFLYSSAFVVDVEEGTENIPAAFILKGAGWGHGVGYCQIGALGMALKGYSTSEILEHYYPGVQLRKIY
ncbi:MAG TPA: SpoIID/LytB domain-containing protein [Candidatus Marinimicrobia bacterium]|nr:SpoIID/LytB domain-containing protein [Candidatus Neomarinimicrobiota bacterium]HRS52200.1 SpoIID/LytB domain-containing protein [Candidatus Neomarinimicrobiota bacterium]HRU91991.1 SpoIID/LytB domain-containing protein [Candidatus Neomarinimicrobiota bacterium]